MYLGIHQNCVPYWGPRSRSIFNIDMRPNLRKLSIIEKSTSKDIEYPTEEVIK
ncbi:hypothetical protein CVS40_3685 [Lucilia cuprina]|nr:hypothetical protein CVS40_3685 [Lucilia cuprina]